MVRKTPPVPVWPSDIMDDAWSQILPGEEHERDRREPLFPVPSKDPAEPLPAEALVAQAISGGSDDPLPAAERLFSAAGGSRERLSAARSILTRRLQGRSDDFEATLAFANRRAGPGRNA